MHKSDPDLRTDAEGARNHIKSVRTAHQFSGRAGLEYRFGGQHAQVLIDDPLRLPLLHDLCWIALNSDLRKAAILQASAPIQNWLSAWLGESLELVDIVFGEQKLEGDLLLSRLECTIGHQPECWFAFNPQVRLFLGACLPALSFAELRSIEPGDFVHLQNIFLRLGRRQLCTVSVSGQSMTVIAAHDRFSEAPLLTSNLISDSPEPFDINVSIQIATLPVRIDTLLKLHPGYTFLAPLELEGTSVGVTVNGKRVGRGRLIRIGGLLGVQITQWLCSSVNACLQ